MIYSKDIQIPLLGCPIHFGTIKGNKYYPYMGQYTPKLVSNQLVQIRISESLYNGDSIVLRTINAKSGEVIAETTFDKYILSNSPFYGYAQCKLPMFIHEKHVYFTIQVGSTILAKSICHTLSPFDVSRMVRIEYTNSSNDFGTVFRNKVEIGGGYSIHYDSILGTYMLTRTQGGQISSDTTIVIENTSGSYTTTITELSERVIISPIDHVFQDGVSYTFKVSLGEEQLAEYTSEYNGGFEGEDNVFTLLVEGGFKPSDLEVRDEAEDYEQQNYENYIVYALPYSTEKITFGGGSGLPMYMYERLAHIFACNNLLINGTRYYRVKGAKVEKENVGTTGLAFVSVEVQADTTFEERDLITGRLFDDTFDYTFN